MDQTLAPAPLLFNENDVEDNFEDIDLARGRAYQRGGMVKNLTIAPGGRRIEGEVSGSQRRPYSVTVTLEKHTRYAWSIESLCTCPVEYLCKHAAALLLQALAQTKHLLVVSSTPAAPANSADPAIRMWLDDLTRFGTTVPPQSRSPKALCYLLKPPKQGAKGGGQIVVVVAKPRKQGGYAHVRDFGAQEMYNNNALYITPEDKSIWRLRTGGGYYTHDAMSEDGETADLTLRKIVATGRAFLGTIDGLALHQGAPRRGMIGWHSLADGSQKPAVLIEDNDPEQCLILAFAQPWYFDLVSGAAGPILLDAPAALIRRFLDGPTIGAAAIEATVERLNVAGIGALIEPPRGIVVEHVTDTVPIACLRLVRREDTGSLMGLVHFDYAGIAAEQEIDPPLSVRATRAGKMLVIVRDLEREKMFAAQLNAILGLSTTSHHMLGVPRQRAAFHFQGTESRTQWLDFLHQHVPALRAQGWRIDIDAGFDEQFRFASVDDAPLEADFREEDGSGWWFSLDLGIFIEGERVALLPLLIQAIGRLNPSGAAGDAKRIIEDVSLQGFLYADLPDGRIAPLPFDRIGEILTTLVELFDHAPLNPDGTLSVPIDLATALATIETATKLRWLGGERLRALVENLASFSGIAPVAPPADLQAILRPYQEQGLAWLQFLREYGLGGILADDMGLGKTVQTLANLLLEKQSGRLDRPCLIICPTSLVPNWQDEAARFAPKLKVLSLHGADRAIRFPEIAGADLVLSTYPLLARDSEQLLSVEWHMVVLDEAQAIKNPTARSTQLACQLKARHRLCLTGTPVENHLGEAWSHFAFLMPGLLGDAKRFNRLFRTPIEKHGDSSRQTVLAKRLKPFILRRTKGQVLTELPPKTEILRHVELGGAQRDFYETLRLAMHQKVQAAVSEKGFARSQIVILDALLKLRQACCDPRLVRLQKTRKGLPSAKLEALMDMLPEMIEEGRRILLFSQFTSMLDLMKTEIDTLGIPYVEIRGETKDRRTPVRQFQDSEVPLFLISLKAGGTGLNLTAADTVIHYDPWWNPAVETQATDRAHRIGQQKNVFVYKLIARDTIEDRILALQDRKRAIGAAILGGEGEAATALSREDLDFLFRGEL